MNLLKKVKLTFSNTVLPSNGNENNSHINGNTNSTTSIGPMQFSLLDAMAIPIIYIDQALRYVYVNKAYAEWFDKQPGDIIGKPVQEFLGNEPYELLKPHIEKALGGETLRVELEIPDRHGNLSVDASLTPDFVDGRVKGFIAIINNVTEKKKTEKELRRRKDDLQDYIDNAAVGLHWVDANGIIIWANNAELQMLGYKEEEYIGHPVSEFHYSKETIDDILTRLSNKETIKEYVAKLKCKDGSFRIVMINSSVLWDEEQFVHTRCFTVDITDQKKSQIALKESEQRYRNLIHGLPAAVYTTDKDGYITLYNEAAVELWGRQPEIGKDMWCGSWKIYEPDGITPMPLDTCPMAIALKEGRKVYDKEIIVERPDGLRKNIKPHPEPIYDIDGNIVGAVNLLLDITERKIAEAQSAKLAAIIQSSEDAIVGKNLNSIVTSWNPGAQKLFGYSPEEMIGQPITRLIPPDRLNEEPAILARLRKGETVDHFDTKRLTKDGRLIDISLTISPIKDNNGKIIGASKIARDITAQKKLDEALRESEERLRMASEAAELGTWEFYPLTNRLIWSDECKKIHGVSAEFEPSIEFINELVHPEEREYVRQETERILNLDQESNLNIIYRIIRENDKQIRWLKVQGRVFLNAQQQPERFVGTMLDITDDKLAEQLLKENEERLRMAIDSTRLGTWEYHPLTQEISCSDECRKIFGVTENIKPDNDFVFEHTHPDDREFVKQEIKKATDPEGPGSCEVEYRILRASDYETRWVKVQGKAFFNSQQQPERFIGTMLDITEDRRQQEELKESVELFQTMADNVPAMIWMSGTDKFDDYFNKTWLEFTGRTLEQECDEGWLEGLHPNDIQTCIDTYNASFKDQKGFYLEYRLRRYDGQYRWIADKSVPRYSAEGEFLGFISACIDIDDQKRFREKIQDSELLFKTISNASPAGLWLTDEDGQNVFVNDTWINWTGKSLEQQLVEGWIGTITKEDVEPVTNKFRQSFKQRKYFNTEFRFRKTDGEERWGLAEGYPYYDINGTFAGYAGSITDITELKKLEQRKDDFIKMASHELKTPITSISGYVQLLLNIYNELDNERLQASKPTVKSSLNTISKQVAKLTRLISELLDLSKIESGKLELHKTEFSLAELVEETVQDVRHTTAKHAIIVNTDFEGNIYADKDRISQVILNLLTNAVKYSPDSDSIEVSLEGNKKLTTIRIRDYGIGIDKKDHQKIFERFYRVEGRSEQTYPGFGIGLFIASEIIHRHYGTISVESEKGKGSLFTVTLPIEASAE